MARVVIDTRPIRTLQGDKVLDGSVYLRLLQARQRKPNLPVLPERTTDLVFVRYIGHPEMAVNEPFLDEWAGYLAAELGAGSNAFVFCHCPDERLDPWLCYELYQRVAALTPLPPLPWDSLTPDEADQRPLF
jgi:uncharacterized protein YecE (DUF72 family)